MSNLWILLKAYTRVFRSDRLATVLTFIVPIFMISIFGAIFGSPNIESAGIRLAFLNQSDSKIARRLEQTLDTMKTFQLVRWRTDENGARIPFDTASIKEYVRRGNAPAALIIPADAYTDTAIGFRIRFYYDPRNDIEMQIVQGMLQKTVMEQTPQMLMQNLENRGRRFLGNSRYVTFNDGMKKIIKHYFPDADTGYSAFLQGDSLMSSDQTKRLGGFFNSIVDFQSAQLVGKNVANPWATRSVGGWAMMFLLFSLSAISNALIDERNNAVFMRILAAPFSRAHLFWSRYLFSTLVGIVQLIVMFVTGSLLFHIDILSNAGNLMLIIAASAATATGFAMLISSIARTVQQAGGIGMILILGMSALGGAWFPTSLMPSYIQIASKFTIVYWSMEGFMTVLWRRAGFVELIPILGVLIGFTAVIVGFSAWRFGRLKIF